MSGISQPRPWVSEQLIGLTLDKSRGWKGTNAGYRAKHLRIVTLFGKADKCENSKCPNPEYHRFEWANLSGDYDNLDRENWAKLCVTCHRRMDKQGIMPLFTNEK